MLLQFLDNSVQNVGRNRVHVLDFVHAAANQSDQLMSSLSGKKKHFRVFEKAFRNIFELRVLGDGFQPPVRAVAARGHPLGNRIDGFLSVLVDVIELQMDRSEEWSINVPMELLDGQAVRQKIRQDRLQHVGILVSLFWTNDGERRLGDVD